MSNSHRNRIVKYALFFLFVCLLLWNLGAGLLPVSFIQEDAFTPTNTQTSDLGIDTPAITFTDLTTAAEQFPTITSTQAGEGPGANSNHPPLPTVFASGVYAQDQLIVRFKSSTKSKRIDECLQRTNVQIRAEIEELNTLVLTTVAGEIANTFYQVMDCSGVLYVEPNFLLQATDTFPNDPGWGLQYGLVNIRAPQGWDFSTGSATVTIAIVDTGVDYSHPDLAGKLVTGYDFVNNDDNAQDDNGHGTHVAGIAAASSNNGTGIAGVAWRARIMPVKVLNASGGGTYADTAAGVVWAVDSGAQVINLSLGGTGASSILEDAINYAHGKGVIVVAAAGNTSSNFVLYPARYPNVIAVARTNSKNKWDGSNYGPEIDLSAPGTSIYSSVIGGYDYMSGSSMSAGFVSGLAAILMSIPGNATPDMIKSQLESTALDIESAGWDEYTGAGLIQMDGAIQLALQVTNPQNGRDLSQGGGPGLIRVAPTNSPTFTPTPTLTMSPTLPPQGTTATFTQEGTATNTQIMPITSTTEKKKDEVEAQKKSQPIINILTYAGIFLMVLGAFLIWYARKKR